MNNLIQPRNKRRAIYDQLFGAAALCIAGLIIMPAMLFNPSPLFRAAQFLGFWFLCWLAGKKNNPLITLLIIAGIVGFNLIIPYGKIIFGIGNFNITYGALMTGIQRAATLEGLIMLSRLTVRRDLRLPGRFGELIGESFRLFAQITDSKPHITVKNLMADIDQLMLDLGNNNDCGQEKTASAKTKPAGFAILAAVVIFAWFLLVLAVIGRPS